MLLQGWQALTFFEVHPSHTSSPFLFSHSYTVSTLLSKSKLLFSSQGSVMQCSRLGLILPPSPVPLLATELHLSHNSITLTNNTTMDQSLVRLILL